MYDSGQLPNLTVIKVTATFQEACGYFLLFLVISSISTNIIIISITDVRSITHHSFRAGFRYCFCSTILRLMANGGRGSFMVFSDFYEVAQKSPTFCRRNKTYKRLRKKTLLPAFRFVPHRHRIYYNIFRLQMSRKQKTLPIKGAP